MQPKLEELIIYLVNAFTQELVLKADNSKNVLVFDLTSLFDNTTTDLSSYKIEVGYAKFTVDVKDANGTCLLYTSILVTSALRYTTMLRMQTTETTFTQLVKSRLLTLYSATFTSLRL